MIHDECKKSVLSTTKGTCLMCTGTTDSTDFILCQTCSEDLGDCQCCANSMDSAPVKLKSRKPGVFFVKKNEKDNGCTVKLKVGEELHVILPEEDDSWRSWTVKDYTFGVLSLCDRGRFKPDPGDMQYGSRTIIFSADSSGQASVEIREEEDFGGFTSTAPWKCTVIVK